MLTISKVFANKPCMPMPRFASIWARLNFPETLKDEQIRKLPVSPEARAWLLNLCGVDTSVGYEQLRICSKNLVVPLTCYSVEQVLSTIHSNNMVRAARAVADLAELCGGKRIPYGALWELELPKIEIESLLYHLCDRNREVLEEEFPFDAAWDADHYSKWKGEILFQYALGLNWEGD